MGLMLGLCTDNRDFWPFYLMMWSSYHHLHLNYFSLFFMTVNGIWSLWIDFTSCTKSCGGGIKSSQRICNNPAPKNEGIECEGATKIDNKTCNSQKCPGIKNTAESRYNYMFGKHQNYHYNEIYHYIETHLVVNDKLVSSKSILILRLITISRSVISRLNCIKK